jgi:hypothetical protein
MENLSEKKVISAEELANYVVCPEAWRLKYLEKGRKQQAQRKEYGRASRQEWFETQDLSAKLRSYAKVAYFLLVLLVIVVFLLEHKRTSPSQKQRISNPATVTIENEDKE